EQAAVVFSDVFLVACLQAALVRRRIEPASAVRVDLLVAVPHVTDGNGFSTRRFLFELIEDLDVGLTTAAGAKKGDADPLVGAQDPASAGGGQRQGRHPGC